ncbi:hypothetical protein [Niastella sp. OAS944]|uniref:hypothetical protein n=1 Tax=Niastella sp. OAS944 TaxID=2664089 RepID=UPI00346EC357|nr:hypothetical protein [Chitinophagaceae bacterium OAS944]
MSKVLQIKVPKPCHENWHNMTPKEQGRFCGSCEKVVIDFSKMSDNEMLDYFTKTAGQSTCGRFANDQLNRKVEETITKPRRFSMAYVWNLLLASVLFFESCNEATTGEVVCEKPAVQQAITEEPLMGIVVAEDTTAQPKPQAEIKGKVFKRGDEASLKELQFEEAYIKGEIAVEDVSGNKKDCKKEK